MLVLLLACIAVTIALEELWAEEWSVIALSLQVCTVYLHPTRNEGAILNLNNVYVHLPVRVNEGSFVGYSEQQITVNSIHSVSIVRYFHCLVGYFLVENNKINTQHVPSCRHVRLSVCVVSPL